MSGFEKARSVGSAETLGPRDYSCDKPSWDEVQTCVRRAHALRSLYFAEWLKRTAASWASVFHRPGRISDNAYMRAGAKEQVAR